jgi:glucose/arabinose dehydrogenase
LVVRRFLIGLLLVAAACDSDAPAPAVNVAPPPPPRPGEGEFGLSERKPAAALAFPGDRPTPGIMEAVPAFPDLSFTNALDMTNAGDGSDRLFVVEQNGYIRVFQNRDDADSYETFLNIASKVERDGGEQGLLGLTFHPDYANTGYFYVYYSVRNEDKTRLSRFRVSDNDPDAADPNSETVLIEIAQDYSNHNGGGIDFGPDGCIYVCVGDGGSSGDPLGRAQDKNQLLGSILRLNDDGSIPADNPFVGVEGRDEIYAWGLRHPWRITFDRETGDCWCGDVGQNAREEIDLIVKGGNYGWDYFEGIRE